VACGFVTFHIGGIIASPLVPTFQPISPRAISDHAFKEASCLLIRTTPDCAMAAPAGTPSPRDQLFNPSLDDVLFSACLDNARKCYLVLKYIYMPVAVAYGVVASMLIVNALWHKDRIPNFTNAFFFALCANALIIGLPTFLVPRIMHFRRLPPRARLAIANTLFTAVCLLVPAVTAHKLWRRQYKELNGFLLVHELLPSAPSRVRPSVVLPHEPLSICEEDTFFLLFMLDHTSMAASYFMLWIVIELPRSYFAVSFSLHVAHFWASAYRVTCIYANACNSHTRSNSSIVTGFSLLQPIVHMVHVSWCFHTVLARWFMQSPHREEHKKWIKSLLKEAVLVTKIHMQSLLPACNAPLPRQNGLFWSRTEFLRPKQEKLPLLLPSDFGTALRICSRLKDLAVYVVALGLPIIFAIFEAMRLVMRIDPSVCSAVHICLFKYALIFAVSTLPHYFFSKFIVQRRSRLSPWFAVASCVVVTIIILRFMRPGSMGFIVLPQMPRFYVYFTIIIVFPPLLIRSFSHDASTTVVLVLFVTLYT
jgi:hypothetical protein